MRKKIIISLLCYLFADTMGVQLNGMLKASYSDNNRMGVSLRKIPYPFRSDWLNTPYWSDSKPEASKINSVEEAQSMSNEIEKLEWKLYEANKGQKKITIKEIENLKKEIREKKCVLMNYIDPKLNECSYRCEKNDIRYTAVQDLLKLLGLAERNVEVRFVNEKSLIKFAKLPADKEQEFLNLLNSDDSLSEIFSQCCNFKDTVHPTRENDKKVQDKILELVEEGCAQSEIFRRAMVCFLALSQSTILPKGHENLIKGEYYSCCSPKHIQLNLGEDDSFYSSPFEGSYGFPIIEGKNIFAVINPKKWILFHECGHANNTIFDLIPYGIFSNTLDRESLEYYNLISNFLLSENDSSEQMRHTGNCTDNQNDGLPTPAERVVKWMRSMAEVWQILGLAYVETNDGGILYINELSDLALNLHLGNPIRLDHEGDIDYSNISVNHEIVFKERVQKLFDVLFRIHSSSLDEYLLKLGDNDRKRINRINETPEGDSQSLVSEFLDEEDDEFSFELKEW